MKESFFERHLERIVSFLERRWTRVWMVVFFGTAALFLAGALGAYLKLGYNVTLSCQRFADSCEMIELKPFGKRASEFRLSEVKGAFLDSLPEGTPCAVINMTRGQPVSICQLNDEGFVHRFNAFLADPAQPRFDGMVNRAVVGYLMAAAMFLAGLVPYAMGRSLQKRARREDARKG